jgi:hypothetical protein
MPPANRNDVFRMDWLARQEGVKVEHRLILENGFPDDTPWSITFPGKVPFAGKTLRMAIDGAMGWERDSKRHGSDDARRTNQGENRIMLIDYICTHTGRGECRCGECFDRGTSPDPTGHVADLVFFSVSAEGSPTAPEFIGLTKAHVGVHCRLDPLDGKEHNYVQLGGWLGDQQSALRYMGLGALLGVFDLLTPKNLIPGMDAAMTMELAGRGMVAVKYKGHAEDRSSRSPSV